MSRIVSRMQDHVSRSHKAGANVKVGVQGFADWCSIGKRFLQTREKWTEYEEKMEVGDETRREEKNSEREGRERRRATLRANGYAQTDEGRNDNGRADDEMELQGVTERRILSTRTSRSRRSGGRRDEMGRFIGPQDWEVDNLKRKTFRDEVFRSTTSVSGLCCEVDGHEEDIEEKPFIRCRFVTRHLRDVAKDKGPESGNTIVRWGFYGVACGGQVQSQDTQERYVHPVCWRDGGSIIQNWQTGFVLRTGLVTLVCFYHAEKVVYEVKVRARLGSSDNDDDDDERDVIGMIVCEQGEIDF